MLKFLHKLRAFFKKKFKDNYFAAVLAKYITMFINIKLETRELGLNDTALNSKLNIIMVIKVCMCGRLNKQWLWKWKALFFSSLLLFFSSVTLMSELQLKNNSGAKNHP